MKRALTWTSIVAATALMLSACDGSDTPQEPTTDVGTPTTGAATGDGDVGGPAVTTDGGSGDGEDPSAATTEAAVELNTPMPVAAGTEREWPEAVGTISEGEHEFTLFGVHRLDGERAVVTGMIGGRDSNTLAARWFEPGYLHHTGGYEFSRVALLDEGGVRHLPVRDEDDRCLCSLSTQVYPELVEDGPGGEAPAWAVVQLPSDATSVDVELPDLGTIEDVRVTELPERHSTPFGWAEVLTVDEVAREDGVVTARSTLANTGDFRAGFTLAQHMFDFPELEGTGCLQGMAAYGDVAPTGRLAKDDDCYRGSMPEVNEQVTLEIKVADPGGERLVLLPDAGLPIVTTVTGTPGQGAQESLRTYAARSEEAGATLDEGEELTVSLDTEVLFAFDKAELTDAAGEAIAVAAEALKAQEKTSIVVAGHTDGQGSDERNEELSEQRAKAVAEALEAELGSGWDIEVEWHGSSQPVAKESGDEEQVEQARARNRRVEVTVP